MGLGTVIDIILGSGVLGLLLFYQSRKRQERATARSSELGNVNMVIEQKNSYIEDLKNEQLDLKREKEELRAELRDARNAESKERNRVASLYKQLSSLNIDKVKMREDVAILKLHQCTKESCIDREPTTNKSS